MTYEEQLRQTIKEAIAISHPSKKYCKDLRKVEQLLIKGIGYSSWEEYKRWEVDVHDTVQVS